MRKLIIARRNNGKLYTFKITYDKEDAPIIESRSWYLDKDGYPTATTAINGKRALHTPEGFETDHIDGDILNARKSNLRIVIHSLNTFSGRGFVNSTGYRGVYKSRTGYQARIRVDGKLLFLGWRKEAEEAYKLYLAACVKYFGEEPP